MSECEKSPLGRHVASFSGRCKYCGWVPPPPLSYEEMRRRLVATEARESTMRGLLREAKDGVGHTADWWNRVTAALEGGMKMQQFEYTQGCSDGACVLRIGPVGQHTNGGCRCLRDVPTDLRIKIMRKFAHERARLAEAEALLVTACDAWECGQMVTGRDGIVLADYKAACLPRDWYEAAKGGRDGD